LKTTWRKHISMLMVPLGFGIMKGIFFSLCSLVAFKISTVIICDFKKISINILKGNLPSVLD
uniref:Uncharacterized protein n=1 Tax=Lynx canadensis TaxID=61383 RepID=A0A667GZ73_LYNCA